LFVPAAAIVVQYGQLMRSDTAGLFFAVLAVWLAVRAMDLRRGRDWVMVAIAIGLAISSRYIFATLVAPYLVAAVLSTVATRRDRTEGSSPLRTLAPYLALFVIPLAFAVTSPFMVLEVRQLPIDPSYHPGADGLSPIGNLLWYVGTIAPSVFGWAILAVAAIGLVAVAWTHPMPAAVLVAFAGSYLVGVSAAPLHWDRYIIPLVPIGTALLFPATTALMSRASAKTELGMTMGTAQTFAGIARVAAPVASTTLFQRVSHGTPFYFAALVVAVVTFLSWHVGAVTKVEPVTVVD
jgi:hypothetical protein